MSDAATIWLLIGFGLYLFLAGVTFAVVAILSMINRRGETTEYPGQALGIATVSGIFWPIAWTIGLIVIVFQELDTRLTARKASR